MDDAYSLGLNKLVKVSYYASSPSECCCCLPDHVCAKLPHLYTCSPTTATTLEGRGGVGRGEEGGRILIKQCYSLEAHSF